MTALRLPPVLALFTLAASLHAQPTGNSLNEGMTIEYDSVEESSLLSWWGSQARFYFIQQSEDLTQWTFMPIFEIGADDVISWGFKSNAPKLFFRAAHTSDTNSELMQADYDEDGLSVWREYEEGSHPFNPDTHGDGIFDGIALKLGLPINPPEIPESDPMDSTQPTISLTSPASAVPLP
jgi:hypothetical protein